MVGGQRAPQAQEATPPEIVEEHRPAQVAQNEDGEDQDSASSGKPDQHEDADRVPMKSSAASARTISFQDQIVKQPSSAQGSPQQDDSNSRKAEEPVVQPEASSHSEGQEVHTGSNQAPVQEEQVVPTSRDPRAAEHASSAVNCGGTLDYSHDNLKEENATNDDAQSNHEADELQSDADKYKEAASADGDSAAGE